MTATTSGSLAARAIAVTARPLGEGWRRRRRPRTSSASFSRVFPLVFSRSSSRGLRVYSCRRHTSVRTIRGLRCATKPLCWWSCSACKQDSIRINLSEGWPLPERLNPSGGPGATALFHTHALQRVRVKEAESGIQTVGDGVNWTLWMDVGYASLSRCRLHKKRDLCNVLSCSVGQHTCSCDLS